MPPPPPYRAHNTLQGLVSLGLAHGAISPVPRDQWDLPPKGSEGGEAWWACGTTPLAVCRQGTQPNPQCPAAASVPSRLQSIVKV